MGCNTSNNQLSPSRIPPRSVSRDDNSLKQPETAEPSQTKLTNKDNALEKIQIQFRNLELYTLLWIDENFEDKLDLQSRFRQIINQLKIYKNPSECETDLQQQLNKNEKYVLIISGTGKTRQLVTNIHDLSQVASCYVLCQNNLKKLNEQWAQNFAKVRHFFHK
jgi:hypothetical protein